MIQFVLGFFGVRFSVINGSGMIGIGFNVVVVVVAALNHTGLRSYREVEPCWCPKYMEWYGGFP
ncbi:MAG TPA: hypothetical protein VNZ03_04995 [Terriglobales bacterium]|nr:hypothetical protein [Terriglobales bacterium]